MSSTTRPAVRFLSLVSLLLVLPLWVAAYSYVRIVRLSWVEGEVSVIRPGAGETLRGQLSLPLEHDAVVETPGGVAEVEFEDETFARLATGSRLHLAELGLEDSGARVTELRLEHGTASFAVRPKGSDRFLVQAGELQLRAQRHARFRVDVTAGGSCVRVFDGEVEVENPSGTLTVKEGRMVEWDAAAGRLELARNLPPDSWDEWVEGREQVAAVLQYRPAPVWSLGQTWNSYSCQSFGWYPRWHSAYAAWYFDPYRGVRWDPWGYGWNWSTGGLYGWGSTGCGGWPMGYWGGWPHWPPGIHPGDPPHPEPIPAPTPSPSPSPTPSPIPTPRPRPRFDPLEPVIPSDGDEEGAVPFRRRREPVPLIEFQPPETPPVPSAFPAPGTSPADGRPGAERRPVPRASGPEPNRARPSRPEVAPRSRESRPAQVAPAPRPPSVGSSRPQSPAPRPSSPPPRPSSAPRPRPRS